MPLPTSALACALSAGLLAATAVAGQRVGLGLAVALVLTIAAGTIGSRRRASAVMTVLAGALALQPVLRDAGWVVALDVVAALVAAAIAVCDGGRWPLVWRALLAPFRLVAGTGVIGRAVAALRPDGVDRQLGPVLRGVTLAVVLTLTFGALFASADQAFAELADQTFTVDLDVGDIIWRAVLALAFAATAGAIARAGTPVATADQSSSRRVPGRTELVIALGALVALFAAFVGVQLRVLFGGAAYVQATTGLGYGDYARQGFVQLLLVAALTVAVVAVAARRRDRAVRALLGTLCALTLVVLVSAHHRLDLVQDAYGFTRVRYAGHAVVAWLAALFALVLAAGASSTFARRLPRTTAALTVAGVLVFSLSNPDARIARRAVDRATAGRPVDTAYLAGLSADALPALERLPSPQRDTVIAALRGRLARPDGIAGFNLARVRAR